MTPPDPVLELVERSERERFERNLDEYKRPAYKETQVRAEFIAPFLEKPWVGTRATCKGAASTRTSPTIRIESPPVWGEWLGCGGRLRDGG